MKYIIKNELRDLQKDRVHIYALIDPRTNYIRYIGSTTNPLVRYNSHLSDVKNYSKSEWIEELKKMSIKPMMKILEIVPKELAAQRENYWIAYYFNEYNLLNQIITSKYIVTYFSFKHKIIDELSFTIPAKNIIDACEKIEKFGFSRHEMKFLNKKSIISIY